MKQHSGIIATAECTLKRYVFNIKKKISASKVWNIDERHAKDDNGKIKVESVEIPF